MDTIFNQYDARLTIPNGTKYLDKEQVTSAFGFGEEQKRRCLIALYDDESKSTTLVSHLSQIDSKQDYLEIIEAFKSQNQKAGFILQKHSRITSADGRVLDVLKYTKSDGAIVCIFSCINDQLFMSTTNCSKTNINSAIAFAGELMTTLRPN